MKRINILSILLLVVSTPVLAAASASSGKIAPFTAEYTLYHHGSKVGSSVKTLSYPTSQHYRYVSKTVISVLFYHKQYQEFSAGKVTKQGYQPAQYALTSNGKSVYQTHSIPNGVQDPLSEVLTLRHYLLTGQTPKAVVTTTANGKQTYAFKLINSHQIIPTTLGKLETVHVRFFDEKGNQVNEWLAKKYGYLPAVIKISKGNDVSGRVCLTKVG